jgi:hypothetical protein
MTGGRCCVGMAPTPLEVREHRPVATNYGAARFLRLPVFVDPPLLFCHALPVARPDTPDLAPSIVVLRTASQTLAREPPQVPSCSPHGITIAGPCADALRHDSERFPRETRLPKPERRWWRWVHADDVLLSGDCDRLLAIPGRRLIRASKVRAFDYAKMRRRCITHWLPPTPARVRASVAAASPARCANHPRASAGYYRWYDRRDRAAR